MNSKASGSIPLDIEAIFPELDPYLYAPLFVNPAMCDYKDLHDGSISIHDLEMMHQIIELKSHYNKPPPEAPGA